MVLFYQKREQKKNLLEVILPYLLMMTTTVVDHCWFRGGWWDPLTMAWNAVKNGEVKSVDPVEADAPGASLYVPFTLAPRKEKIIRVMMAWYTPDSDFTIGTMGERKENCDPASGCCTSPDDIGS